jgi:hypothetical protein
VIEVELVTFQDSVANCPATIDTGLLVNEVITGTGKACVVAWMPADGADELPVGSWALTEYVYVVEAESPVSLHEVTPAGVVAKRTPLR